MSVRTDYLNLVVNVNGNAAKKDYYDLKARAAELHKELQSINKVNQTYIDKSNELTEVGKKIKSVTDQAAKLKEQMEKTTKYTAEYINKNKELSDAQKKYQSLENALTKLQEKQAGLTQGSKDYVKTYDKIEGIKNEMNGLSGTIIKLNDELEQTNMYTDKYLSKKSQYDAVNAELIQLKNTQKSLKEEIKNTSKESQEYIAKSKELKEVEARIDSMRGKMDLASLSIKDLRKEIQQMKAVRDTLDPASDAFRKLSGEISTAETRLKNLQGATSLSEKAFNFLKKEVMAFGMIAVAALGFDYLIGKIGNVIQRNAELSDSFADVARYTNLTDQEVIDLNKSLSQINTRTARKDLLGYAGDAGKLGITGKKNILEFVQAADQIKVALGEDLGQDAIIQLTKLNNVFKITEKYGISVGEALTKSGSVVNKLGADSAASEKYLVDFMTRLGPVASQVGLTITQLAGLASASDELGLSAEVTSTVFNQVFPKMSTETEAFAKVAGMSVKDFSDLLANDANAAMLKFLEGMKGNNEGMGVMAEKLKDIEVDGTRGIAVIAALAENTDKVTKAQKSANEEFKLGTSIVNEFNKRNENFAADIEKIKKGISNFFANSDIIKGFQELTSWVSKFFEIPISKKLEDERMQLISYEIQLKQSNLSQEDRVKIIKELQSIYPDLLGNIDAETVSNNELFASIKSVNDQLINKIVLQKKTEEVEAQNESIAKTKLDLYNKEVKVRKLLAKMSDRYDVPIPAGKDLIDIASKFRKNLADALKKDVLTEQKILDPLIGSISTLGRLTVFLNKKNAEGNNLLKERQDLMKALGIKDEVIAPIDTNTNTDDNNTPPPPPAEPDAAAEEARKKAADAYAELKKHIAEMEREALLSTLSANQKELEAIYDKYQKEIIAAKGHKTEIAKLERLRDAEYFATLEKQKQEEADKRNKAYQSFINDYEAFKEKEWEAGLTAREKEEVAVMQMYDSMAEKTMEALKNKVITQEQHDAIMQGLALQQSEHMKALQQKFLAEDELAQTEHLNKLAEFYKKLAENPFQEGDPYEAERQRIKAHYDALLAEAKLFFDKKIMDEKAYNETSEKINKQRADANTAVDKKEVADRVAAQVQGYNALASQTSGFINMLTAENQKYTKAQKAATLLQLSMDTASAISSLVKYSQQNPLNAPTFGAAGIATFASGLVQIMSNIGMAMKVLSSGTVPNGGQSVNQKAEGGYTTVQGADDRENYRAKMLPKFENGFLNNPSLVLAGEKGTEYFVNNDMLQNPDVAQIVAGIEALSRGRISQVDFSQMLSMPAMQQKASGGYTSPSFSTASVTPVNNSNDTMLLMVAESLAKLNKHLDEGITSNAFIGDPTIIEFQKRQSYLSNIEKEAN